MGVIKRDDMALGCVSLNLKDVSEEAETMLSRARAEASRILGEARAERERIVAGAAEAGREEGYKKGFEAGLEAGRAEGAESAKAEREGELSALAAAWSAALESLENQRESLLRACRQDVLRLAVVFAERVVRRIVELDDAVAADQLDAVIRHIGLASRARVRIHPEDAAVVRESLPTLTQRLDGKGAVELIEDDTVGRGGCVVSSGGEGGVEIDATIDTQLQRLACLLLPDGGPADDIEEHPPADARSAA